MRQLCSFLDTQQPGNRFACSYGRVCSCFLLLFHFPSFFHLLHFPRSLSPNNSGERLTLTPSESDQPEVKGFSNHTPVPMSCKLDSSRSRSSAPLFSFLRLVAFFLSPLCGFLFISNGQPLPNFSEANHGTADKYVWRVSTADIPREDTARRIKQDTWNSFIFHLRYRCNY